jgi:dipeptidyl aminopeptidase/acylaminoacyl peptidase
MNPNAGLPRRETLAWANAYLAAILIGLYALGGMAVGSEKEQTLSVATTWQLPREPKAVCFALSPDSDSLALMRTNGDVEIWSTLTHELLRKVAAEVEPKDRFTHSLLFSPDGHWLAILSGGPLRVITLAGGTNGIVIGKSGEAFYGARFSRDGCRLLVAGRTERVVGLPGGEPIGVLQAQSPGVAGRPVLRPLSRHGTPPRPIRSLACALSPDGAEVALGQQFYEVERWDVATGECRGFVKLSTATLLSTSHQVSALNYAPSGGELVAVLDGNQWDVALAEPDGTWRTLLRQTPLGQKQTDYRRAVKDAFFTPDGKEIVLVAEKLELGKEPFEMLGAKSVGAEVQFLDVATGVVTRRLDRPRACFFSQAWVSTDGRRLMVLQRSYTLTPRTHAERQAQHLREADCPAALLTVPLDRQSAPSKP